MPFTRHFKIGSIAGGKTKAAWPFGLDGDITYASSQTVVVPHGALDDPLDYDNFTVNNGVVLTLEPTDPTRPIMIGAVSATIEGTLKVKNDDTELGARIYSFTDPNNIAYSETRAAATALGGNGGSGGTGNNAVGGSGGAGTVGGGGGGGSGDIGSDLTSGGNGGTGGSNGSTGTSSGGTPGSGA